MRGTINEEWKPVTVLGFEHSREVSSLGRVRTVSGRILAQYPDEQSVGYLRVTLCAGGRKRMIRVHRLVTEAFLGPCPPGMVTRHGPGGALDNRAANLSYGTQAENVKDRRRDGTEPRGDACPWARLTEPQVSEIRAAYAAGGVSQKALAVRYGVDPSNISRIISVETWAHVTAQLPDEVA